MFGFLAFSAWLTHLLLSYTHFWEWLTSGCCNDEVSATTDTSATNDTSATSATNDTRAGAGSPACHPERSEGSVLLPPFVTLSAAKGLSTSPGCPSCYSSVVTLSAAKGLARWAARCFAEFTLSATNGLSMTVVMDYPHRHPALEAMLQRTSTSLAMGCPVTA